MAINLSDLPPKYQQQAEEKYMKQQKRGGLRLPPPLCRIRTGRRNIATPPPSGSPPPGPFSALTVKKRPGDMTT